MNSSKFSYFYFYNGFSQRKRKALESKYMACFAIWDN